MSEFAKSLKAHRVFVSTIPEEAWVYTALVVFLLLGFLFFLSKKKTLCKGLAFVGIASLYTFVIVVTLTGRGHEIHSGCALIPLSSYVRAIESAEMQLIVQIIFNVVVFIPIGFLMPICIGGRRKYLWTFALVSIVTIVIEILQGVLQIGFLETDDLLNNLLGTSIGVVFYYVIHRFRSKICAKNVI